MIDLVFLACYNDVSTWTHLVPLSKRPLLEVEHTSETFGFGR